MHMNEEHYSYYCLQRTVVPLALVTLSCAAVATSTYVQCVCCLCDTIPIAVLLHHLTVVRLKLSLKNSLCVRYNSVVCEVDVEAVLTLLLTSCYY
jgi:hypothetical protein